jgi:uncharacterized membrane protein
VLSFLILAVFWVRHHNLFHFVSHVDNTFVWLNIAFLLTIGFVPFSTELIGRFWNTEISTIIYGANLSAMVICMQGIWSYSTRTKLVADGLDGRIMSRINRRMIGGLVLYLLAILVTLTVPSGTEIALGIYILSIVYYVLASSIGPRNPWRRLGRAK